MAPDAFSFRYLKKQVGIGRILSHYGLDHRLIRRGEQLFGPCPLHGGDNRTAFRVHIGRGLWRCFTACGGGDTVELIRKIEHCSYAEAAGHLQRIAEASTPEAKQPTGVCSPYSRGAFTPFTRSIPLDPRCHFLQNIKAIRPVTALRFEAGTTRYSPFLKNTVAVRLHDMLGNPLGYCGRRIDPDEAARFGKWRFPKDFPKAQILYNAHRAQAFRSKGIILVECPWAVMRITQAGFPNVVALLGTNLSQAQTTWLASARSILVVLDGDPAGDKAASSILSSLRPYTSVLRHQLENKMEPEDLSDPVLRSILRTHFPSS
jgi:DNA primase